MDFETQSREILRGVEKVVGFSQRGILSKRETINKITDELAHYRRGDLAEAVLSLLTPELAAELRAWVGDVSRPDYRYRFFGVGTSPPEDYMFQMQAELVSLASRLARLGIAPAGDRRSGVASDA